MPSRSFGFKLEQIMNEFCIFDDLYGVHVHCRHMVVGRA
jgi:hypothetical protein